MRRKLITMQSSRLQFQFMVAGSKIQDVFSPPRKLMERSGVKPNQHVLNFGCGTGNYALAAAEIVGMGGRVYALDIHPLAMLRVRYLAEKKGMTNMQTILSEGTTNLPDGVIDIVLMCNVFLGLEEPDKVLTEMYRVLKPEGMLVCTKRHMRNPAVKAQIMGGGLFKLSAQDGKLFKFNRINKK